MTALSCGARVAHRNERCSYGRGQVAELVRPLVGRMTKAYVRFDGETADRLVWLDDLSPELPGQSAPVRPSLTAVGT